MAQKFVSGTSGGSLGRLGSGNSRVQGPGASPLSSDIPAHQGSQSAVGIGSLDGGNSQLPERSPSAESIIDNGNDEPLHQVSANLGERDQNTLRHAGDLGFVALAAISFDAAKDIMDAL
ncbi:hypothetical protein VNO77_11758 [Canavalia gladiata]|uniref:Uncharacterized protein n=1 Tax=Canavalia gladiata TaxID=3824 RepID=A0AAN9MCA2_CANGL